MVQGMIGLTAVQQRRAVRTGAVEAARAYGLEGATLSPLADGQNHVFRVVAPDRRAFVLRIMPAERMSRGRLLSQLSWLRAIRAEAGVVTPRPAPLPGGDQVLPL